MASRAPVKLNGVTLAPHMIAAEAQHHPARTPGRAVQSAARAIIIRTLLLERARRLGVDATPELIAEGKRETEDEASIRALLETEVPVPAPSEEDCAAYYGANATRFHTPDLFEASHILFAADPKDKDAGERAMARAQAALAEIQRDPRRFDAIAKESSDCASRTNGGRLGQLARGETVAEFDSALSRLRAGEVAPEPVKSQFGVHIVRLDARDDGKILPYPYVRDRIETYLAERQWRKDVARYIDGLAADAVIEGVDMGPQSQSGGSHEHAG